MEPALPAGDLPDDPNGSLAISKRFLEQAFSQSGVAPDAIPQAMPTEAMPTMSLAQPLPAQNHLPTALFGGGLPHAQGIQLPAPVAHAIESARHAGTPSVANCSSVDRGAGLARDREPLGAGSPSLSAALEKLRYHSVHQLREKLGNSPLIQTPPDPTRAASGISRREARRSSAAGPSHRPFDVQSIRDDFPALHQSINGHPLIWFDNAATTHKPNQVIEALTHFYAFDYSNIHRAAHTLAARATDHYEAARETVRQFIHAKSSDDIVFVRGTTEGINFIAHTCKDSLREGDEILLSELEHHANIVPWQMIARERRARIRVIPIDDRGEISLDDYRRLLNPRTRVVSLTHASNTLGTVLPIAEMAQLAHHHGARVVVDGAQSIAHLPVDVSALGCDFFVFSGHKVFAPTGIGVVYVHPDLQDKLPPWQGGGNMIRRVSFDETIYADAPAKFEAGTPSIGDAVGLGAALNYLRQFDPLSVSAHEHSLLELATHELGKIRGLQIFGRAADKVGVVSFTLDGFSTETIGRELDRHGIAVRTGHHCAQPSLRHFGLESTVRPSFAIYNTSSEVERLVDVMTHLARHRR